MGWAVTHPGLKHPCTISIQRCTRQSPGTCSEASVNMLPPAT